MDERLNGPTSPRQLLYRWIGPMHFRRSLLLHPSTGAFPSLSGGCASERREKRVPNRTDDDAHATVYATERGWVSATSSGHGQFVIVGLFTASSGTDTPCSSPATPHAQFQPNPGSTGDPGHRDGRAERNPIISK